MRGNLYYQNTMSNSVLLPSQEMASTPGRFDSYSNNTYSEDAVNITPQTPGSYIDSPVSNYVPVNMPNSIASSSSNEIGKCIVCNVYTNNVASHMQTHSKEEIITGLTNSSPPNQHTMIATTNTYERSNSALNSMLPGPSNSNSVMMTPGSDQSDMQPTDMKLENCMEPCSSLTNVHKQVSFAPSPQVLAAPVASQPFLRPVMFPSKNMQSHLQPHQPNVPLMISAMNNQNLSVNHNLSPAGSQPLQLLVLNNNANKTPTSVPPHTPILLSQNRATFSQYPNQTAIRYASPVNSFQPLQRVQIPNLIHRNPVSSATAGPKFVFMSAPVLNTKNSKVLVSNNPVSQVNNITTHQNVGNAGINLNVLNSGASCSNTAMPSPSSVPKSSDTEQATVKVGNNIKISLPKDMVDNKDRLQKIINEELIRGIMLNDSGTDSKENVIDVHEEPVDVNEPQLENTSFVMNPGEEDYVRVSDESFTQKYPETEYIMIKEEESSVLPSKVTAERCPSQENSAKDPSTPKHPTSFYSAVQSSPVSRPTRELQESGFPSGNSSFKIVEMTEACELTPQSGFEVKVKADYLLPEEQLLFSPASLLTDNEPGSLEDSQCIVINSSPVGALTF